MKILEVSLSTLSVFFILTPTHTHTLSLSLACARASTILASKHKDEDDGSYRLSLVKHQYHSTKKLARSQIALYENRKYVGNDT